MKEKKIHIIAVVVIVVFITTGLVLIHVGNTPLYIQIAHLFGFLLFFIGMVLAIVALFIAYISIHNYLNKSNGEGEKN